METYCWILITAAFKTLWGTNVGQGVVTTIPAVLTSTTVHFDPGHLHLL